MPTGTPTSIGTPIGGHAIAALAWSVGIALAAYLWARRLYNHRPAR
jgi:ABC-2 type transport system permease protein